jgi:hypothetical protein
MQPRDVPIEKPMDPSELPEIVILSAAPLRSVVRTTLWRGAKDLDPYGPAVICAKANFVWPGLRMTPWGDCDWAVRFSIGIVPRRVASLRNCGAMNRAATFHAEYLNFMQSVIRISRRASSDSTASRTDSHP